MAAISRVTEVALTKWVGKTNYSDCFPVSSKCVLLESRAIPAAGHTMPSDRMANAAASVHSLALS